MLAYRYYLDISANYIFVASHPLHVIIPPSNTTAHMSSFLPSTVRDWNQLPLSIIESTNYNNFLSTLTDYMYHS